MKSLKTLKKHYKNFEWLALIRLIKKFKLKNVNYFFKSSPLLHFAPREIADFKMNEQDLEITANFMGLQGASTPLPLHFTEHIVQDDPDDSNLNEFLNFFNQRFYEALIRIDEKYHYIAQALPHYEDPLSQNLQALAGLPKAHSKSKKEILYQLLPGLRYWVGGQVSKQGLCLFLRRLYQIDKVVLKERVKKEIAIPMDEQNALGIRSSLGETLMLGKHVYQAALHFELHFYVEEVSGFLPGQQQFKVLQELLGYILHAPLFVTLVLHAKRVQVPILKKECPLQLGYTSVLVQAVSCPYQISLNLR